MKDKPAKKAFFNKKARFDYEIIESYEAGIALQGNEIKAIRSGRINITGSYAKIINGELFWLGGDFNLQQGDSQRTKKLLMTKKEINRLIGKTKEQGFALIPLKLYIKKGKAKLELGLGKGLKKHDKRNKIKEREQKAEAERKMKNF